MASRSDEASARLSAREDLARATRLTLGAWRPNLGYGVVTAAFVAVVLGPAISWLLVKGMQIAAGGTVLNYDIAGFVLSPAGLLLFLLWTVLVAFVAVVSQGGHAYAAAGRALGRDVKLPGILRRVAADLPRVPGLGAIQLALLSVLLTPLIAAAVGVAGGLLLAPFQGTSLLERLPRGTTLWVLLGLGAALLALGLWLYVRWSLTIPGFSLEGRSLRDAVRTSRERVRGRFWGVLRGHLLHHVTWGLLVGVVALVLGAGLRPLVRSALASHPDGALWVLALVLAFVTGVFGLLTIFGVARLVALTVVHHRALGGGVAAERLVGDVPRDRAEANRRRWALALGALLLLALGTVLTLPRVEAEISRITSAPTVTAHRGSSIEAPQNTLAAVRLAIEDGADAVEFDVHQAKDGALVVFHDVNLKRLAGIDANVYDLTGEELVRIDVGSHGDFASTFAGETIPTLEQVLDAAQGKIGLNVELKVHTKETPDYARDVVDLLRAKGWLEDAYITSLDEAILREVRRLEPRLWIGAIITAKVGSASALDCDIYSVQPLIATNAFIRRAHALGREVHVWTINDEADMTRVADRGVDGVITDLPRQAKALYAQRTQQDELAAAIRRLFE